jgi:hypothetical protein
MDAEIGGKAPAARRPAGEAANPRTLYPTDEAMPGGKKAKAAAKPAALDTLKPGDVLASDAAPQIVNRSFKLACTIETKQTDAVILAQGGVAAGYALHLTKSRVAFAVRTGAGDAITEITAPADLTAPMRITAALAADGAMTLQVNEQPPITGKSRGLILRQPAENFCLGHDDAKPVGAYTAKEPFKGSISNLSLTTP